MLQYDKIVNSIYGDKTLFMTNKPICGYKKRNGEPCQSTILLPNGRCRVHGTRAKGKAHWNYKDGKKSRYAPANELGDLYERAKQDADLKDLSDDMALITAFINQRLSNIDTMTGIDFFADLGKLVKELKQAIKKQDLEDIAQVTMLIDGMANRGVNQFNELDAIVKLIEQRRKLSDSQSKRETELLQFVTINQVMSIMNLLIAVVFEHIHSSRTKQLIYKAYEQLLTERFPNSTEALTIPSEASSPD